MKLVAVALFVGMAVSTTARAQDPPPSLKLPLVVYASTAAMDYHSTHYFLQFEGMAEGNPLISWLDHKPTTMLVVGAAMEATAVYVLHRWIGKKHPKLARVALYVGSGLRVGAAAKNYHDTRGHDRIPPPQRQAYAEYRR